MSFSVPEVPNGPVAGEPDDCGDVPEFDLQASIIEAAYEVGLIHYVMIEPTIGIAL